MAHQVLVQVVGFTDVERQALDGLFSLAEDGGMTCLPWQPDSVQGPQLVLVDGDDIEGPVAAHEALAAGLPVVWVGADAPAGVARSFQRPLAWPELLQAMEELAGPALDFDIDLVAADTQPPAEGDRPLRVLIASTDRDRRLYMRAKLALAGLTQADEAESAAQALELARGRRHAIALLDHAVAGDASWQFVVSLRESGECIRHVIVTKHRPGVIDHIKARLAGAAALFDQPPHPGKLHALLLRLR